MSREQTENKTQFSKTDLFQTLKKTDLFQTLSRERTGPKWSQKKKRYVFFTKKAMFLRLSPSQTVHFFVNKFFFPTRGKNSNPNKSIFSEISSNSKTYWGRRIVRNWLGLELFVFKSHVFWARKLFFGV